MKMLYNSIPVIMYHHIAPTDRELNIYPEVFEDQLRSLRDNGWRTLSGEEYIYYLRNHKERPDKCVLITFDDGFADNYVYAYPILKKYGMKAVMFVAIDFIEDTDADRGPFVPLSHNDAWEIAKTEKRAEVMCTWNELEEMDRSGVFDVQSHGVSHRTPDYFNAGTYRPLMEDLVTGKKIIEKRLGKSVLHFAWPRGRFDDEGIKIAQDTGYRALYTTERGANTVRNLEMINRLPVKCKKGKWLTGKLRIYSSTLLSKVYLKVRSG